MKKLVFLSMILSIALAFTGCSDDSDEGTISVTPTGQSTTYILGEKAVAGISGTATFVENDDNSTTVTLSLNNTPEGGSHPAHIHFNTAVESGGIAISLAPVDGSTGTSSITFAALNDGTPITYSELLDFDGYINVHLSADELGTTVAQGDIGQNELTGTSKSYALGEMAVAGISGTAIFSERANGEALAVIALDNTPDGGSHPAHIHFNTAVEGGGIAFSFNPIDGTTGMSITNVAALDDDTAFGYDDFLGFDGYINVHLSADELGTIVAQGDIGQNELTSNALTYALNEKAVAGISGTVTFTERVNGEALAVITLSGTPEGGSHPAHIHVNSAAEGGSIAFTFTPIDGTTGMSKTNVATLNDNSAFGFTDISTFNGYINVHLSTDDLATIVAQGDIGSNVN